MISTPDLYKEVQNAEDLISKKNATTEELLKGLIKVVTLNIKLLHNMRTNTVRVMDYFKIPKVKPRKPEDVKKVSKEEESE